MTAATANRRDAAIRAHASRRILRHWADSSAEHRRAGLDWYGGAQEFARALDPANPGRAAGVIAALSPRCGWSVNCRWAAEVIAAADRGDAEPPTVHTTAMRRAAWRIAQGEDPLDVLGGPKTRAFYRSIMGDPDAVTVDVWAARAAEGREDPRAVTGRRYDRIAGAYRDAARIAGVPARDLQAAVWCHVRGAAH